MTRWRSRLVAIALASTMGASPAQAGEDRTGAACDAEGAQMPSCTWKLHWVCFGGLFLMNNHCDMYDWECAISP